MSSRSFRRARERDIAKGRRGRLVAGVGAALGASVVFAPLAQAGTFVVDTIDDSDDTDNCDNDDCTLREAADDANDNDGADTITFAANVTGEITIDTANYGSINFYEEVTVQGPGADVLAISGDDEVRILYIDASQQGDAYDPVTISGLTLRDGLYDVGINDGGAVAAFYTTLTLTDMVFTDNEADDEGGAVFTQHGNLAITSSLFSGNTSGGVGGAVSTNYTEGSGADDVEILIQDVVSQNNSAGDYGGSLYFDDSGGDVVVERLTSTGNESTDGGAGLGVDKVDDGDLTINAVTLSGNTAEGQGGGLWTRGVEGTTVIQNSTISGNEAGYEGGGIYFGDFYGQPLTVRNSTIVDNVAGTDPGETDGGGGVYLYEDDDEGGDDEPNGPLTLSSTIVANNTADFGDDLGEGSFTAGFNTGFSLVENASTGARAINESPAGTNIFGQDPQLGPLASNGGPTQTHFPAVTSPVLDKGIANGLATDQRGLARTGDLGSIPNPAGGDGTDIGAVEVQAADCRGSGAVRVDGSAGDDTLTGSQLADAIFAGAGNDTANGAGGNDCVNGDEGKDSTKGGPGKDIVRGGKGADRGAGGGGKDKVKGNAGKDSLKGGGGADKLSGAGGKDTLKGGGGKDRLKGGPGKDKLTGGSGKDRFNCGGGNDKVTAQPKDKVSASCEKVIEKG